jgi:hypothetical protein
VNQRRMVLPDSRHAADGEHFASPGHTIVGQAREFRFDTARRSSDAPSMRSPKTTARRLAVGPRLDRNAISKRMLLTLCRSTVLRMPQPSETSRVGFASTLMSSRGYMRLISREHHPSSHHVRSWVVYVFLAIVLAEEHHERRSGSSVKLRTASDASESAGAIVRDDWCYAICTQHQSPAHRGLRR